MIKAVHIAFYFLLFSCTMCSLIKDSYEGAAGALLRFHELCPIHPFKHAVLTYVKELSFFFFFTLEFVLSCITMLTNCIYLTFFFKSVGINQVIIIAASWCVRTATSLAGLQQSFPNTQWRLKHARAWLAYHLQHCVWAREDTSKCYTKATTPGQTRNGALRRSCSKLTSSWLPTVANSALMLELHATQRLVTQTKRLHKSVVHNDFKQLAGV